MGGGEQGRPRSEEMEESAMARVRARHMGRQPLCLVLRVALPPCCLAGHTYPNSPACPSPLQGYRALPCRRPGDLTLQHGTVRPTPAVWIFANRTREEVHASDAVALLSCHRVAFDEQHPARNMGQGFSVPPTSPHPPQPKVERKQPQVVCVRDDVAAQVQVLHHHIR